MEWVATAIAVIAAAAAIWQAWEARRARRGAQSSAQEAADHEVRAVQAAERMAAALEEQTAVARAEREQYKVPWQIVKVGKSWDLRLTGNEVVTGVNIAFEPSDADIDIFEEVPATMRPGQSIRVQWEKTFGSPSSATMRLAWTRPNGDEKEVFETLR